MPLIPVESSGPINEGLTENFSFCSTAAAFYAVLAGLFLALSFSLVSSSDPSDFWLTFGLYLLAIEWICLLSLLILCQLQKFLGKNDHRRLFVAAVFLVVATISIITSVSTLWLCESAFSCSIEPNHDLGWFVFRFLLISLLISLVVVRYLALSGSWKRQMAAESSSRLDALQARIRPHFLFNALNTITELVHSRPGQAEEALLDLSDLLRTGLRSEARHTLEEEFELVRGYLRIEGLRLGERLKVDWSIDDSVDRTTEIPALLVQPLVENAVLHGIAPRPDGGTLAIRLESSRFGRVRIIVENPLPSPNHPRRQGNRTALGNIRQRLALAYEEGASLKTEQTDSLFRAVLTLPLKTVLGE